jgi:5-oxoprolinase (ATP-hydrolysing) subunit A
MKTIDLNCDMGETPEAIADGTQESLMPFITSINVACGGHAGDEQTMKATIEQALCSHMAVGAHPGYADRVHFGRLELHLTPEEIADSVYDQVRALAEVAADCGARLTHVKPHGALYNQAARDGAVAQAIAAGVARYSRELVLVGLAGSAMLDAFRESGFIAVAEAFADRRYEPDGNLRSRKFADAMLSDPAEAVRQALRIAQRGTVIASDGSEIAVNAQTICIHSDTRGALEIARAVNQSLRQSGVELRPMRD